MSIIEVHLLALTLAFFIDLFIGDPRWLPHPVRGMGLLIIKLEKRLNNGNRRKQKGFLFLFVYLFIVAAVAIAILVVSYQIHFMLGIIIEAVMISTTIATKGLKDAALLVYQPLQAGNLKEARNNLAMIVGRDTEKLEENDITRATVETVAENTSDGITAPLFYALLGGGVLAIIYRAINTTDSMVGYKNERYEHFGFAAAKLDDIVNYIPSRLTGIMMVTIYVPFQKNRRKELFSLLFQNAKNHPSPNSGWLEAAMAAILGVRLGGQNSYGGIPSFRAYIGRADHDLNRQHIVSSTKIMMTTCCVYVVFLWLIGGFINAIT